MSRWDDSSSWSGDGLRREVFFFDSGGVDLYGSFYAASAPVPDAPAVVFCHSWGIEADRANPLAHAVALAAARLGGSGLVFHYPGYADSMGDLRGVAMTDLARAAADAQAEAARRHDSDDWLFAGFALGAAVAVLARRESAVRTLLLLQPELAPGTYFERLVRSARRAALGTPREEGIAYGYPVPDRIVATAAQADADAVAALDDFDGAGAVVRYAKPADPPAVPARFEDVVVDGSWRFGARDNPALQQGATEWLRSRAAVGAE